VTRDLLDLGPFDALVLPEFFSGKSGKLLLMTAMSFFVKYTIDSFLIESNA